MKKRPESKAGQVDCTPTPPTKRRLASAQDLRLFLGDILNKVHRNEIDIGVARCLGYLAQTMTSIITASDLEQRLAELEEKQK